jgi:DNA-binding CsgD family transcriptional regulator
MGMRRSSSVLVGRDEDVRALEAALADRGVRPVILVGGEAGIGKSRLVADLAARLAARDVPVVVGSCVQLGADALPYAPFVDALSRYVEILGPSAREALGASAEELATLLPEVETADPASPVAQVSRGRLYEAVRSLLDRAPDGLTVVLEDIHWADRSSLELLVYLAGRLRRGRAAIVASFRTDELHRRHPLVPVLAELSRSGRTTRIDLDRLGRSSVAELVRAIRGDAPDELVDAIAARSDGNPFLVEELIAVDAGPLAPLPGTLRDLLLARLAALAEPTREMLGIVSTIGRPADPALLEAAWEGTMASLDISLREAVDRSILVIERASGRFTFAHALIREAVADDLLPGESVRQHAKLAAILAAHPDLASATRAGAAAEVAHHLYEAHDLPGAFGAAVRAAEAAMDARAYPEARAMYERALDLLARIPEEDARGTVDRIQLLDSAAEASFHGGDAERAMALGREAVSAAEGRVDSARLGHLLGRLLEWSAVTGEIEELSALGERAVALVPADPPTTDRALVLLSLASVRMHAARHLEALELARESARVAAASGALGNEASAESLIGVSLVGLGRDREAVDAVDRAVLLAERSAGTVEVGITRIDQAGVYSVAGRYDALPAVLIAARAAVDREGLHDMSEPWLATDEVDLLAWQGRWVEAEALATGMIERRVAPSPLAWHLIVRGALRVRTGRLDDGERDLTAALAIHPLVEPEIRAKALGECAEAALGRQEPLRALELVGEALEVLAPTDEVPGRAHLHALGLRAAADLADRSRARRDGPGIAAAAEAAAGFVAGLEAAAAGLLVEGGVAEGRVASRVAWGRAEETRRAGATDAAAWADAAVALDAAAEPYLAALCRCRGAEAELARGGERSRPQGELRAVLEWATAVGAAPLREEVEALARRARLDVEAAPSARPDASEAAAPAPAARTDPYGLSSRELEVLALLTEGRTNREIGARLFITEKTASSHVTHILDKLGVPSRGAAAALAARGKLVGDPPA